MNGFIDLIDSDNTDLDDWLHEMVGCARTHSWERTGRSLTQAVALCDLHQARHVFEGLALQVAALIQVSQERPFTLNPIDAIIYRKVNKKYEDKAQVAYMMLQAFSEGLKEARSSAGHW